MTPLHQMLDDLFEGLGWFVGIVWGCLAVGIVAIAFGTAALSPSATEPVPVSSHSGDGRLSQGEVR